MERSAIATFLSGRMLAMVVLLVFQITIARLLSPGEYGVLALVLALAALFQTVNSFGVPRLIPRYFSQAGTILAPATVRLMLWGMTGFRLAASLLLLLIALAVAHYFGALAGMTSTTLTAGTVYILVSIVQVDSDAMTQALGLQAISRACLVGEGVVRLLLVLVGAYIGKIDHASDILAISCVTAGVASLVALVAVLRALGATATPDSCTPLDRREFRSLALGGWASAIAWFASSPAIIRLIAARLLPMIAFAGFAFVQGLVLSFQRYTPGMLVFPFVEANVMQHFARTGDRSRLENALSLVVKIDMLVIGGAIVGTAVAGGAIVDLLSSGRYGAAGMVMPWILAYILTTSVYRAFEIVSVALGATAVLTAMLAISAFWMAVMLIVGLHMGLFALLLFPVADAVCRLALMTRQLRRFAIYHVLDLAVSLRWVLLVVTCSGLGMWGARATESGAVGVIACGTGAGLAYMAGIILLKPFRAAEMTLLDNGGAGFPGIAILRRLTA